MVARGIGVAKSGVPTNAEQALDARVWAGSAEGKASGILSHGDEEQFLQSGWSGPSEDIPRGTNGFDIVTRTHVEGHAAAVMRTEGLSYAELEINAIPCPVCAGYLPAMLPENGVLVIYGPGGYVGVFVGQ